MVWDVKGRLCKQIAGLTMTFCMAASVVGLVPSEAVKAAQAPVEGGRTYTITRNEDKITYSWNGQPFGAAEPAIVLPGDTVEFAYSTGEETKSSAYNYNMEKILRTDIVGMTIFGYNYERLVSGGNPVIQTAAKQKYQSKVIEWDSETQSMKTTINGEEEVWTSFVNDTGKVLSVMKKGGGGVGSYIQKYEPPAWAATKYHYTYNDISLEIYMYEPYYELKYDLGEGSVQEHTLPDAYYVVDDASAYTFTLPCPVQEGKHFEKWSSTFWNNSKAPAEVKTINGQQIYEVSCCYSNMNSLEAFNKTKTMVARYVPGYTITFDGMGGLVNGVSSRICEIEKKTNGEYAETDELDLNCTKDGCRFAGWYLDADLKHPFYGLNDDRTYDTNGDGERTSEDTGEPFEDGSYSVTLYAKWEVPVSGITLDNASLTFKEGATMEAALKETIAPENASVKDITWSSSNPSVATVDAKGNVKGVAPGTADITATTKDGGKTAVCKVTVLDRCVDGHKAVLTFSRATMNADGKQITTCSACGQKLSTEIISGVSDIELSEDSCIYNGKKRTPSVTVKDSRGNVLKEGADYKVSYMEGRTEIGKYQVTITLQGEKYSGSKTVYFSITPKKTTPSKVSAGKRKITVKWKKNRQASGYQIQYSMDKKFKKSKKTVTISKNKTTSKTITKLKAKKKYYVRTRAYKIVKSNGKKEKYYSPWSKVKSVKVK